MADNKKWKINNIPLNASFSDSADVVIRQRLDSLVSTIKIYFDQNTPENLHDVRISLRRLRYSMEIFYDCFSKKKFISLYQAVEQLQALSGYIRDIDVMFENINSLSEDSKVKVSEIILKKLKAKKTELTEKLKLDLMKFNHSKRVKKFI